MNRDHHVALAQGWSLWRWIWLRGSGFPARTVLQLAAPDSAAITDRLRVLEDDVAAAGAAAIGVLEAMLDGLAGKDRKPVGRALRKLRSGSVPELVEELAGAHQALRTLQQHEQKVAAERAVAEQTYQDDQRRLSSALREIAGDPRFNEACLWQNRGAVQTAIDRVRTGRASNANQHRQHEQLVARYLQRYCTKNDTIGFFGPVGWGALVDGANAEFTCGSDLLVKRTVYFEHWAIDALASTLSQSRELREQLAPRRIPTMRLDAAVLHRANAQPITLPTALTKLLASCDGTRSARSIAEHLTADSTLGLESNDDVFELLDELVERALILWQLEVPTFVAFPEEHLREQLRRTGAPGQPGLASLSKLEAARAEVQQAAGDPIALDSALSMLDQLFEQVAAAGATRRAGQAYAGRTIVYEDCQRALSLRLGRTFVDRIARPLALILQSARWYTFTLAERFRARVWETYQRLHEAKPGEAIDYPTFYSEIISALPSQGEDAGLVADVTRELGERWASVLRVEPGAARVTRRCDQIEADGLAAFAAPHPGWAGAGCHELDLLVVARSFEEANRTGVVVLGEVHPAMNMAMRPLLSIKECPFAEELIRAYEHDVPGPGVSLVIPKSLANRATAWSPSSRDFDVEIGTTASPRNRDHVIAAMDLVVERDHDRIWICTRDGRHRFDALAHFEYQLMQASTFRVLPRGSHLPRVSIDEVVVQRELWQVSSQDLAFVSLQRGLAQFAAVRRWAHSLGLPRWVFVKAEGERKPVYVDFESTIFVEAFVKLVRGTSNIIVTEMLPSVDETWLRDAEGNTYTCELRLAAIDPVQWPHPNPRYA